MMTFMVMSALVFSWILAKVYGPVARAAVVITSTSGFEAAILL